MNTINKNNSLVYLLIVSIIPYFLEKRYSWFTQNLSKIIKIRKINSFFQDNTIFIEKNQKYNFSQLLRELEEMGYEKVFKVEDPGEFSRRGGIIEVFPINMPYAVRIDFLGNLIEEIQKIEKTEIKNEEKAKEILKKKLKSQRTFSDLKGLKEGDYLVHIDHGIGRFKGISKFKIQNSKLADYYVLEYDKGDKLYVPLGLEKKLSRYIGFQEPKISRLGTNIWQKTKKEIKQEAEKFAKKLLQIYSQKELTQRKPYQRDKEIEAILELTFEYEETPDQKQAFEDIVKDLSKTKPMDRLICGDVGFGKTEIAIRTALIAAINGMQTALICPTTILANQHFNTFKRRFKDLPIKIALLTRLQSKKEQNKILKEIENGKIDITIGTHRLFSSDIKFKNLQLLIIDDEQRFGVSQKEKFREANPALDILSLSATPIPRTLYLALSSIKDISLIQTPPFGRKKTKTKVLPYNEKIIKKAIEKELKREGQVYFLHNRTQTIENVVSKIRKLCPNAKVDFIHGRISEEKLIKTMQNFQDQKIDVLVATTIIENGLDLPNVNTIIIEDASRLGLSQAHQIRGRIGRGFKEAIAYLFYNPKKLTPKAKERLLSLRKFQELGDGYKIALKDLELRGAGNILGKEQAGAINKVGLNLYSQILSQTIEKLKS